MDKFPANIRIGSVQQLVVYLLRDGSIDYLSPHVDMMRPPPNSLRSAMGFAELEGDPGQLRDEPPDPVPQRCVGGDPAGLQKQRLRGHYQKSPSLLAKI